MNGSIKVIETVAQKEVDPVQLQTNRLAPPQRWLSLAELAVGSAIVIGHNVYHVIPNEVPILFVLGLLSLRLRDGSWTAMGLRWPASWRRTILFALAAAALRILLGALVIDPVTAHFWPPAVGAEWLRRNPRPCDGGTPMASADLDLRRLRRRDWIPGLSTDARGRRWRPVKSCLLGWRLSRRCALRIRTLLQRSVGDCGLRHGWPDSWGRLRLVGTQPVGLHSGPWIH